LTLPLASPLPLLLLQLLKAVLALGDATYPMAARKQRIVLRVLQDITGARWTYRTEQYSTPSSLPQVTVNASAVAEGEAAAAPAAEGEPWLCLLDGIGAAVVVAACNQALCVSLPTPSSPANNNLPAPASGLFLAL
jgi:hypothetical protein